MEISASLLYFTEWKLDDALAFLKEKGVSSVEVGFSHDKLALEYDLAKLARDERRLSEFKKRFDVAGLKICSFNCVGNCLHPIEEIAESHNIAFKNVLTIAGNLEVPTVVSLAGCPGGSPTDMTPNWITCSWPEDFPRALDWQWSERVIPYWKKMADYAKECGVKVAIEMHPGFVVYDPHTLLRLREAVGPTVGATLDPSQLIWQQIDVINTIRVLNQAIYHVHLKDTQIRTHRLAEKSILDTTPSSKWNERAWLFRTMGFGKDISFWADFLTTLHEVGYTGPLSVEHEDVFNSVSDGMEKAIRLAQSLMID